MEFLWYSSNNWNVYMIYCGVHILIPCVLNKNDFLNYENLKRQNDPRFFPCVAVNTKPDYFQCVTSHMQFLKNDRQPFINEFNL